MRRWFEVLDSSRNHSFMSCAYRSAQPGSECTFKTNSEPHAQPPSPNKHQLQKRGQSAFS